LRCPKCDFDSEADSECPRCGVIFKKFKTSAHKHSTESQSSIKQIFKEYLFHDSSEPNAFYLFGRLIVFFIIFIWGLKFITSPIESNYAGNCFLHLVNLPFHEAGHVIFSFSGEFITKLGGTLGQLLMPLICLTALLVKTRDPFGASVCLWWLGENFMDIAPYIQDARALKMPLLGGVTGRETVDYHDWEFILKKLGLLQWDHSLAKAAQSIGIILMLVSFAWGGYLLYRQYQNLKKSA